MTVLGLQWYCAFACLLCQSPHMYHRCPAQNIERETNIVRLPVAILGNLYRRACDMLRSVAWKFSKTLGKMLGSFGSQIGSPKRNRYR